MKMPIFILSMLFTVSAFCQDRYVPLWEEDSHFCYYRVLQIEGQISRIHTLLHNLDCKNAQEVQKTAKECQDHLDMVDVLLGNKTFDELRSSNESATEK